MESNDKQIDFRRLGRSIMQCRWIIIAIIIIFTTVGGWKSMTRLPKYDIKGEMLIGEIGYDENGKAGGISQMMKPFSVGGFGAAAVDNEILIMGSHDVLKRTVRMLGLNRFYVGKLSDGEKEILYNNSPIRVEAPAEFFDTLSVSFKIRMVIHDNGLVDIKATKGFFNKTLKEVKNTKLPILFETQYGSVQILPSDTISSSKYTEITVSVSNNDLCALNLAKEIEIDVATKLADVIEVGYQYPNSALGMAIVNGVMAEYNAKRLERLHEASVASIKYYDERIAEAFKELQKIEKEVSDYQRANELMGIDSELGLLVNTAVGNKPAIMTANYNIAYYETVLDILRNRLNDDVIIPQMESLNDPHIAEFNGAIQARRDLKRSATDDNEVLIRLNERILGLRDIIIENSEKMIAKARADVQHQQELTNVAQNRLDKYPDYELEFKNLLRDKEYRNSLYQYLVSQRESSVLQLYSTTNIGFIFQPAYVAGGDGLIAMLKWPIALFLFALFLGLCIAGVRTLLNNKTAAPMDLAFLGIDGNAVKFHGSEDSVARMRALLTANPDRKIIYSANFTNTDSYIDDLTKSIIDAGYSVDIVESQNSNDYLLSPEFAKELKRMENNADYIFVHIPNPERLFEFEHSIDSSNANILLGIPSDMKRNQLKRLLKNQTIDRIHTFII